MAGSSSFSDRMRMRASIWWSRQTTKRRIVIVASAVLVMWMLLFADLTFLSPQQIQRAYKMWSTKPVPKYGLVSEYDYSATLREVEHLLAQGSAVEPGHLQSLTGVLWGEYLKERVHNRAIFYERWERENLGGAERERESRGKVKLGTVEEGLKRQEKLCSGKAYAEIAKDSTPDSGTDSPACQCSCDYLVRNCIPSELCPGADKRPRPKIVTAGMKPSNNITSAAYTTLLGTLPGRMDFHDGLTLSTLTTAFSLLKHTKGSGVPFVAMYTVDIPEYVLTLLRKCGVQLHKVPIIPNTYQYGRTVFSLNLVKINAWNLPYDRVMIVDSDMIFRENINHLFLVDTPAFTPQGQFSVDYPDYEKGVENPPKHHQILKFNAGFMVIAPDKEVYRDLIARSQLFPSDTGGEQGFQNEYHKLWYELPRTYQLQKHRSMLPSSESAVREWVGRHAMLHYVGTKPMDCLDWNVEGGLATLFKDGFTDHSLSLVRSQKDCVPPFNSKHSQEMFEVYMDYFVEMAREWGDYIRVYFEEKRVWREKHPEVKEEKEAR